jgi:hypothetical protein
LLPNLLFAQVVGKIFDKEYADKEFGNVKNSVEISNSELLDLLDKSGEYIMLNIDTGEIRALNNNRESVQGFAKSDNEVFHKMSTSQVKLLIEKGSKENTSVEMRPETLTLTNGQFTLELTIPCPPFC